MQVGPVGNRVAKVDPYAKPNGSIDGVIAIMTWGLLLYFHGAAHRPVDAVEYDQQRIPTGLYDPTAMLSNCRID
jgi:hypothetical protein